MLVQLQDKGEDRDDGSLKRDAIPSAVPRDTRPGSMFWFRALAGTPARLIVVAFATQAETLLLLVTASTVLSMEP